MSDKPNVIVFFTDQQRWDSTGVHGNPLGLTPNFDRVAQRGTHLYNSFTCQPVCGPARACLQTGRYATQHGVFRNHIALPSDSITLAPCFKAQGYETAYIGKWHLASQDPVPKDERGGYDTWLAANLLEFTSEPYNTVVYDEESREVKLPGYRVDALVDAAIRYVDRQQDTPFFLFLSLLEPHHQNHVDDYVAPHGYREHYYDAWTPPDLAALGGSAQQHLPGYYGIVRRIDEAFGRLLDALDSLALTDNTIVLFTSDHGCHFKTRNAEYKRSCHESSIRVPTALTGPGFVGGGRVEPLVSLIDLPSTLLDAAGIPIPESFQGRSIMPLLSRDPVDDWPQEVFLQISESEVGRALRTRRWKYSVRAPDGDPFQDPHAAHYVEDCLYDLHVDPYELTNLAGMDSHRALADWLKASLLRRMAAIDEPVPTIENAPARPADPPARRVDPSELV